MNQNLKDRAIQRATDRIPAVRALGGVDAVKDAASSIEEEFRRDGASSTLRDVAGSIPAIARLLWRVARDPQTPGVVRIGLPAVAGYLISPIDPIPDFLPVVGSMDDAVLAVLAVRWLLGRVDEDLLRSHWTGSDTMFRILIGSAGKRSGDRVIGA